MRAHRPPDPERRLLIRTRRLITVQVAGAISLLLALVGVVVYGVTVSDQDRTAQHELAAATRRASVAHPPPCISLFELRGDTVVRSPGAPVALPVRPALDRVAGYQAADRRRLLRTLGAAEVAGLLAAVLIGQVLARRAIAPLGEALSRQRRFAADVSHELRTPLTRLHTRAQLLARRLRHGTDPVLAADEVDQLVTGTRQLGEVVEDLLVSARFKQGHRPFDPVDLAALAEELVAAEAPRAQACGVTVELRRGPGGHVVRGAESALRRVISALLDNALRHTDVGGRIAVDLSRDSAATVRLTVRDDGVGLDPRDAERLFTRFVGGGGDGDGRNRGFGLGLALVREVVDGHGGTITADGRPGAGAVFTVRLPADPADAAAPGTASAPRRPASATQANDHLARQTERPPHPRV
jgi:signal transduction histidine kinase